MTVSQHDLDITNQLFPDVRTDLNKALKALGGLNAGTTTVGMFVTGSILWPDLLTDVLKMRKADDSAWVGMLGIGETRQATLASSQTLASTLRGTTQFITAAGGDVVVTLPLATDTPDNYQIDIVRVDTSTNLVNVHTGKAADKIVTTASTTATKLSMDSYLDDVKLTSDAAGVWYGQLKSPKAARTDVAQQFTKAQNFARTVLTGATSIAWNPITDQVTQLTATIAVDFSLATTVQDGLVCNLRLIQGSGGSHIPTFTTDYLFAAATLPTWSTAAGSVDHIWFVGNSDGELEEVGRSIGLATA